MTDTKPQIVDEEFRRAAEEVGFRGSFDVSNVHQGYTVSVLWHGALEMEAVISGCYGDAKALARGLIRREMDPDMEVTVTHVYVTEDAIEHSGYGPYGAFRWDPDAEEIVES